MKKQYTKPCLNPLSEPLVVAQNPCWTGGVAAGGQCSTGGTAGTTCATGHSQFAS